MRELISELGDIVGPAGLIGPPDHGPATVDLRGTHRGEAIALVRPGSVEEVAAVLRACSAAGAVVVTQGGNTGMSGGAVPSATGPSVILSLARMTAIESVDADRYSATVEAGVTIETIQEAAAAVDRLFAPDWGARGTATVGGAISTNAGGINVLRFGTMRDHVLGLEVVLPDGRVWDGLRALRKDSSGYDLKHLFIGAEGTLGVVTRAVVRLLPAFTHQQSALAAIPALAAVRPLLESALRHAAGDVTAFELIPERGVGSMVTRFGRQRPLGTVTDWYVLVRFAGAAPVTDALSGFLAEAAEAGHVIDAAVASTPAQEENLWLIRDEILPGVVFENHTSGLKMDTAVPIDRIEEYLSRIGAIATEIAPYAEHYAFGHVGDGNIHSYVVPAPGREAEFRRVEPELRAATDRLTWEMGGTLSAEHGVGQALTERIRGQKGDVEIDLVRGLKRLLDPTGLLNPDKTLPVD